MSGDEVDGWFKAYGGPQKANMLRVREILLSAEPRLSECVKWQTPTFVFNGNMASFNPRAKKAVSLVFHHGASIPGDHPLLRGDGPMGRTVTLASEDEVRAAAPALGNIARAWCDSRSG